MLIFYWAIFNGQQLNSKINSLKGLSCWAKDWFNSFTGYKYHEAICRWKIMAPVPYAEKFVVGLGRVGRLDKWNIPVERRSKEWTPWVFIKIKGSCGLRTGRCALIFDQIERRLRYQSCPSVSGQSRKEQKKIPKRYRQRQLKKVQWIQATGKIIKKIIKPYQLMINLYLF